MWTTKGTPQWRAMRSLHHSPVNRPLEMGLVVWKRILSCSLIPILGKGVGSGAAQHPGIGSPHRKTTSNHGQGRWVVSSHLPQPCFFLCSVTITLRYWGRGQPRQERALFFLLLSSLGEGCWGERSEFSQELDNSWVRQRSVMHSERIRNLFLVVVGCCLWDTGRRGITHGVKEETGGRWSAALHRVMIQWRGFF